MARPRAGHEVIVLVATACLRQPLPGSPTRGRAPLSEPDVRFHSEFLDGWDQVRRDAIADRKRCAEMPRWGSFTR